MIDRHVDGPTPDGVMPTFVTQPEEGGPHPVVLVCMDAPGTREEQRDMARRLGTAGCYVALPDLHYRDQPGFSIFSGDPSHTRERMWELMASLDDARVVGDTAALLAWIDADPAADGGRLGCMGYCMSGPFSFAVACAYPDRIGAAASLYGVRRFGPGSPAGRAAAARAELYFACAEFDEWVPADMVDGLERHLAAIGAHARVERYQGTHHGFAFPVGARPTTRSPPSATGSACTRCSPATSPRPPPDHRPGTAPGAVRPARPRRRSAGCATPPHRPPPRP